MSYHFQDTLGLTHFGGDPDPQVTPPSKTPVTLAKPFEIPPLAVIGALGLVAFFMLCRKSAAPTSNPRRPRKKSRTKRPFTVMGWDVHPAYGGAPRVLSGTKPRRSRKTGPMIMYEVATSTGVDRVMASSPSEARERVGDFLVHGERILSVKEYRP